MTDRPDGHIFSGTRRGPATVFAAAAFLALAGCATATVGDAVPVAAGQVPAPAPAPAGTAGTATVAAGPVETPAIQSADVADMPQGPVNTGTFPNLNVPPQAAATQISRAQKTAKMAELKAAQGGQVAPPGPTASAAEKLRLKKLAATHAADALKEIENN